MDLPRIFFYGNIYGESHRTMKTHTTAYPVFYIILVTWGNVVLPLGPEQRSLSRYSLRHVRPTMRLFIAYLPNCIVSGGCRVVGETYVSPFARYTHHNLMPSLMYREAHTYTVSLLKTIPAGFLTISAYTRLG